MGLDMYLEGRKYYSNWDENEKKEEDGFELKEKTLNIGYWRKHPNLHGFIVESFGDGKDECQDIELSDEDVSKIIEAIKKKRLPKTSGFFFGTSCESYDGPSIEIFEKALKWVKSEEKNCLRYLVYRASW